MKTKIFSKLASSMIILALFITGCSQNNESIETTAHESEPALWEVGDTRNKIVVISDIHIGIDDKYAETVKNRSLFIDFLKHLQSTTDVRELVIDGDFLDEWYLPVYYPSYTDVQQFYKNVIANNQSVIDELNNVIESGIKLVYIPGNHDMTQENKVLQEAIPEIVQIRDAKGLGTYYTGDRNEIVIEHGHRYDVFSAPDTVTNAELCGNDDTILPAGYFFARYAATWVLEGHPKVDKNLPVVTNVPDQSNTDQYGAYIYYSLLKDISVQMTPNEGLEEEIFDMHMAGFDDAYTYLDFYPVQEPDGTISAPVLFRNIQRTWEERQKANQVKVPNTFLEAVSGTLDLEYYFKQAKVQYLENVNENVDVVLFGHTHVPTFRAMDNGKYYINQGTWIDHNTKSPEATRTFAVITTGEKTIAELYRFEEDCTLTDIAINVVAEDEEIATTENPLGDVTVVTKALENYGDDVTQARYLEVSGLKDTAVQDKLNQVLKEFCLEPTSLAEQDTIYDIEPAYAVVGGDLLSVRTYNTAYTTGAAYPVNSMRTQTFSLSTGEMDIVYLWDFIVDSNVLKQMALDGKFGFSIAGMDGKIPEDIKILGDQKLAKSMETPEIGAQFYFDNNGRLFVWCEGENHATGDYWLFDIPVKDLAEIASERLIPIIEEMKNRGY